MRKVKSLSIVVQSPSHVRLFATPWTASCQASLSLTISQSLPKFIASVMPSSHLILWYPLLLLFPASESFPVSWLFASDDQNTGASSSVLPVSIQGWSPLRLTGLISLLSKGLLGVFSSTAVRRHQFFGVLPSLRSSSHNYVTTGKTAALTIRTFVSRAASLLTNTLSRFVITFLPRSNRLLISWLQSLSSVILEPMKRKSVTTFTFSLSICQAIMGPDTYITI